MRILCPVFLPTTCVVTPVCTENLNPDITDAHLIGIDPDYRLHVSDRLLNQNDGSMLEALKRLNGRTIHRPNRQKDWPDRDRLDVRFERFKTVV